jgi:hypothetical protein
VFFERSQELAEQAPAVYGELAKPDRVNPAEW